MKAEERKHLEENTLAHGVTTLMERAKSGRLVNFRWLAIGLAVVLIAGVWWYAVSQSRQSESKVWSGLAEWLQRANEPNLATFAETHPNTAAARIARMEAARQLLGPEGILLLQTGDKAERNRGVENLKKARDEFSKLAAEFEGDKTLKATCLLRAGEAELALVGVPQENGLGSLGEVDAAADLYRKAAQTIGESTPVGEQANKRADELLKQKEEIKSVGIALYDRPLLGTTTDAPKAPTGLLPDVAPLAPQPEAPKEPEQPLGTAPAATGGVVGGVAPPSTPPAAAPPPAPQPQPAAPTPPKTPDPTKK